VELTDHNQREFEEIIEAAHRISADIGLHVEHTLRVGLQEPLSPEEQVSLLDRVLAELRAACEKLGDQKGLLSLAFSATSLVEKAIRLRMAPASNSPGEAAGIEFLEANGISPQKVQPTPIFHEREIPMMAGYVRLEDIKLWPGNKRLEIHLAQFEQENRRPPSQEELRDIMTDELRLPGLPPHDQFKIRELARSIANNGVQRPPILAYDGTLLDGNRRVTACQHILESPDFSPAEKRRVQNILVWRLSEYAGPEDQHAVIVALNFEPEYRLRWPDYIRAREIFEQWHALILMERRTPSRGRETELKKQLARQYAISPNDVNRYLKMMMWAGEFEDYLTNDRNKNPHEVRHVSNEYFQYFDEIAKGRTGRKGRGVAQTLDENEGLKHLLFDLLYEGKIDNFTWIRDFKYLDGELYKNLERARKEPDVVAAQDLVEGALAEAKARNQEITHGENAKIAGFVAFLEKLPVSAFRDKITEESLNGLLRALELVREHVEARLKEKHA
jgi:hypothetical protein